MANYIVATDSDLGPISLGETDTVRSILQNIQCILRTRKGTIPLYREFGLEMAFVDKPLQIARQMMLVDVRENVEEFEPRAQVVDIRCRNDPSDPGRLIPVVEVKIIGT